MSRRYKGPTEVGISGKWEIIASKYSQLEDGDGVVINNEISVLTGCHFPAIVRKKWRAKMRLGVLCRVNGFCCGQQ